MKKRSGNDSYGVGRVIVKLNTTAWQGLPRALRLNFRSHPRVVPEPFISGMQLSLWEVFRWACDIISVLHQHDVPVLRHDVSATAQRPQFRPSSPLCLSDKYVFTIARSTHTALVVMQEACCPEYEHNFYNLKPQFSAKDVTYNTDIRHSSYTHEDQPPAPSPDIIYFSCTVLASLSAVPVHLGTLIPQHDGISPLHKYKGPVERLLAVPLAFHHLPTQRSQTRTPADRETTLELRLEPADLVIELTAALVAALVHGVHRRAEEEADGLLDVILVGKRL